MRILAGVMLVGLCAGAFAAEISPEVEAEVKALKKHVSMGSVTQSNLRDKTDAKFEVFKVITEQDRESTFIGTMRFTVEMTDKSEEVFYGQVLTKEKPSPTTDETYNGEHVWEFRVPYGQMKYPKFTYAMEFGIETTNKTFVPVSAKYSKVESGDEITARNTDPKKKLKLAPGRTRPNRTGDIGVAE